MCICNSFYIVHFTSFGILTGLHNDQFDEVLFLRFQMLISQVNFVVYFIIVNFFVEC